MTTTLQEAWATMEFAFIVAVIVIALWRTMHYAALEAYSGSSRMGNFLHETLGRKKKL